MTTQAELLAQLQGLRTQLVKVEGEYRRTIDLGQLPPPLSVMSMAPQSITEGHSGTKNMTFSVVLAGPQPRAIRFDYATVNGTATAGQDYIATSGTKTVPAGATGTTIDVPIIGDRIAEANETFTLRLTNPVWV